MSVTLRVNQDGASLVHAKTTRRWVSVGRHNNAVERAFR
jgi:hypothetical protein